MRYVILSVSLGLGCCLPVWAAEPSVTAPAPSAVPVVPAAPAATPKKPFNLCDYVLVSVPQIFEAATQQGQQVGELEEISNPAGKVIALVYEPTKMIAFYATEDADNATKMCGKQVS